MVVYCTAFCLLIFGLFSTGEWKNSSYQYWVLVTALKCFDCAKCPENPKEGEVPVKTNCKTCLLDCEGFITNRGDIISAGLSATYVHNIARKLTFRFSLWLIPQLSSNKSHSLFLLDECKKYTSRTYSGRKLRALSITCSPVCPPTKGVDAGSLVTVKVKCCYRDLCTGHAVSRIPSAIMTLICLLILHLFCPASE
ncbi:hypothetical protein T265_06571 [Opisthorchis viverrini]|uniref:UPAR/Ly6 domain-containing protein n=1 Tax=Opisthorchis viverrini TaxID=6198 RepID=A0A074ZFN4_OPIVI|nr:hypothetical protein T265_06571 [Opisthorchis viverrini]KER26091.1 hypothetical protein T265_06571 [Opisthorchis viverrini]